MLIWTYYFLLLTLEFTGLALAIVGLPGLWIMVGAYGAFAWLTGLNVYVGWQSMIAMLVLALAAEIIEFVAGAAGSAKAGGSKRGMIGAVVGAFAGMIIFTPLIPIPVVGTVLGMCIGSFGGAFLVEMGIGREMGHAANVGWGAAKGRFWGTVVKLCFGAAMLIVAAIFALPI